MLSFFVCYVLPIISLWQDACRRGRVPPASSPHQVLQFAKLVPKAWVGGGQGLGDGGIVVGYAGLRGSTEVSTS